MSKKKSYIQKARKSGFFKPKDLSIHEKDYDALVSDLKTEIESKNSIIESVKDNLSKSFKKKRKFKSIKIFIN